MTTPSSRRSAFGAASLAIAALLGAASCSPQREPTAAAPTPGVTGATTGAAAPAAPGAYDPKTDPLVNPKTAFEPAPGDTSLIATDETLFRTLDGNPNSLNPLFQSSLVEFNLLEMLWDGPFSIDRKMDWMLNPVMVEHFEESADHLLWTVKLKPGLKWQDGKAFTSEDVCWSYKEIMDERVPCPAVRSGTDQLLKCEAPDPLTFKLYHKEALPTNKWNANFPIIPKHLYEKDKKNNPDLKSGEYYVNLNRKGITNGPYKLVNWVENDKIELERWEDYPGPKPHFKRVVFRIIPDQNVQLLTFNKGDIDEYRMGEKQFATQTGPDSDFAKVGMKLQSQAWDYSYMGWNMDGSNPFFSDVKVRRAMTHACNIPRMIREINYNLVTPSRGVFHPESPWYNPDVQMLEFDLDKAAALLDEAGWKIDESQGGYRYKTIDGKPVRFHFTFNLPQGRPVSRDSAVIFQEDLKSIGVEMELQSLEWATFIERNRKHDFQAYLASWGTGVDPDTQWNLWRSDEYDKQGNFGRNYGGYSNKRVDELFRLGRVEFDHEKRRGHYQEVAKILYEDQPYTFLWHRSTLWAANRRIRGIQTGPRGLFNTYPGPFGWWVAKDEQKYPALKP